MQLKPTGKEKETANPVKEIDSPIHHEKDAQVSEPPRPKPANSRKNSPASQRVRPVEKTTSPDQTSFGSRSGRIALHPADEAAKTGTVRTAVRLSQAEPDGDKRVPEPRSKRNEAKETISGYPNRTGPRHTFSRSKSDKVQTDLDDRSTRKIGPELRGNPALRTKERISMTLSERPTADERIRVKTIPTNRNTAGQIVGRSVSATELGRQKAIRDMRKAAGDAQVTRRVCNAEAGGCSCCRVDAGVVRLDCRGRRFGLSRCAGDLPGGAAAGNTVWDFPRRWKQR